MSEEPIIDAETHDPEPTPMPEGDKNGTDNRPRSSNKAIRDALRQVESLGQNLGEALAGRGNVVMVRVNDDALRYLDILVDAEVTRSRSESAAFLINEGVKANQAMFDRIEGVARQIEELRAQLRETIKSAGGEPEA